MFNLFKSTKPEVAPKSTIELILEIKGVKAVIPSKRPLSKVVTLEIELDDLEDTQDSILGILEKTGNLPVLTGGITQQDEWLSSKKYYVNYAVITK